MCDMKPFGELSDAEKGALLLAHHEGKKIQCRWERSDDWAVAIPTWGRHAFYRIAPDPLIPDSIDWSHVAPEWKFMAREPNGLVNLFKETPWDRCVGSGWQREGVSHITAKHFASYRRGTVDWKDSLVRRPS